MLADYLPAPTIPTRPCVAQSPRNPKQSSTSLIHTGGDMVKRATADGKRITNKSSATDWSQTGHVGERDRKQHDRQTTNKSPQASSHIRPLLAPSPHPYPPSAPHVLAPTPALARAHSLASPASPIPRHRLRLCPIPHPGRMVAPYLTHTRIRTCAKLVSAPTLALIIQVIGIQVLPDAHPRAISGPLHPSSTPSHPHSPRQSTRAMMLRGKMGVQGGGTAVYVASSIQEAGLLTSSHSAHLAASLR
ncbi:hypothetical protein BD779DRAFT_1800717 [Infundibulicybe gibba]|nr:hypothetical protein BD779DRAFT_1800717 [Infundibulicybe gibba]